VEDSGKPAEFFPWDKSGLDMAVLKIEGKLESYWVVFSTGETAIVRGKKAFHNDLLLTLFFQPFLSEVCSTVSYEPIKPGPSLNTRKGDPDPV
jgi:hypothetical protein